MTNDELIKHRLHELEELAAGWHAAERRVDTLGLSITAVERSVAKIEQSLEKNAQSMERLHERLDVALTEQAKAEAREEGRVEARKDAEAVMLEKGRQMGLTEARRTNWKVVGFTIMAMIPACGVAVTALNLILN